MRVSLEFSLAEIKKTIAKYRTIGEIGNKLYEVNGNNKQFQNGIRINVAKQRELQQQQQQQQQPQAAAAAAYIPSIRFGQAPPQTDLHRENSVPRLREYAPEQEIPPEFESPRESQEEEPPSLEELHQRRIQNDHAHLGNTMQNLQTTTREEIDRLLEIIERFADFKRALLLRTNNEQNNEGHEAFVNEFYESLGRIYGQAYGHDLELMDRNGAAFNMNVISSLYTQINGLIELHNQAYDIQDEYANSQQQQLGDQQVIHHLGEFTSEENESNDYDPLTPPQSMPTIQEGEETDESEEYQDSVMDLGEDSNSSFSTYRDTPRRLNTPTGTEVLRSYSNSPSSTATATPIAPSDYIALPIVHPDAIARSNNETAHINELITRLNVVADQLHTSTSTVQGDRTGAGLESNNARQSSPPHQEVINIIEQLDNAIANITPVDYETPESRRVTSAENLFRTRILHNNYDPRNFPPQIRREVENLTDYSVLRQGQILRQFQRSLPEQSPYEAWSLAPNAQFTFPEWRPTRATLLQDPPYRGQNMIDPTLSAALGPHRGAYDAESESIPVAQRQYRQFDDFAHQQRAYLQHRQNIENQRQQFYFNDFVSRYPDAPVRRSPPVNRNPNEQARVEEFADLMLDNTIISMRNFERLIPENRRRNVNFEDPLSIMRAMRVNFNRPLASQLTPEQIEVLKKENEQVSSRQAEEEAAANEEREANITDLNQRVARSQPNERRRILELQSMNIPVHPELDSFPVHPQIPAQREQIRNMLAHIVEPDARRQAYRHYQITPLDPDEARHEVRQQEIAIWGHDQPQADVDAAYANERITPYQHIVPFPTNFTNRPITPQQQAASNIARPVAQRPSQVNAQVQPQAPQPIVQPQQHSIINNILRSFARMIMPIGTNQAAAEDAANIEEQGTVSISNVNEALMTDDESDQESADQEVAQIMNPNELPTAGTNLNTTNPAPGTRYIGPPQVQLPEMNSNPINVPTALVPFRADQAGNTGVLTGSARTAATRNATFSSLYQAHNNQIMTHLMTSAGDALIHLNDSIDASNFNFISTSPRTTEEMRVRFREAIGGLFSTNSFSLQQATNLYNYRNVVNTAEEQFERAPFQNRSILNAMENLDPMFQDFFWEMPTQIEAHQAALGARQFTSQFGQLYAGTRRLLNGFQAYIQNARGTFNVDPRLPIILSEDHTRTYGEYLEMARARELSIIGDLMKAYLFLAVLAYGGAGIGMAFSHYTNIMRAVGLHTIRQEEAPARVQTRSMSQSSSSSMRSQSSSSQEEGTQRNRADMPHVTLPRRGSRSRRGSNRGSGIKRSHDDDRKVGGGIGDKSGNNEGDSRAQSAPPPQSTSSAMQTPPGLAAQYAKMQNFIKTNYSFPIVYETNDYMVAGVGLSTLLKKLSFGNDPKNFDANDPYSVIQTRFANTPVLNRLINYIPLKQFGPKDEFGRIPVYPLDLGTHIGMIDQTAKVSRGIELTEQQNATLHGIKRLRAEINKNQRQTIGNSLQSTRNQTLPQSTLQQTNNTPETDTAIAGANMGDQLDEIYEMTTQPDDNLLRMQRSQGVRNGVYVDTAQVALRNLNSYQTAIFLQARQAQALAQSPIVSNPRVGLVVSSHHNSHRQRETQNTLNTIIEHTGRGEHKDPQTTFRHHFANSVGYNVRHTGGNAHVFNRHDQHFERLIKNRLKNYYDTNKDVVHTKEYTMERLKGMGMKKIAAQHYDLDAHDRHLYGIARIDSFMKHVHSKADANEKASDKDRDLSKQAQGCEHCGGIEQLYHYSNKNEHGVMCKSCVNGKGITMSRTPIEMMKVSKLEESSHPHAKQILEQNRRAEFNRKMGGMEFSNAWKSFEETCPKKIKPSFGEYASSHYIAMGDSFSPQRLDQLTYLIGYITLNRDAESEIPPMLSANIHALILKYMKSQGIKCERKGGISSDYKHHAPHFSSFNQLKEYIRSDPQVLCEWYYTK